MHSGHCGNRLARDGVTVTSDEDKKKIVEQYVALRMKGAEPHLKEIYAMFFPTDGRTFSFDWAIEGDKLIVLVEAHVPSERN